MHNQLLAVCHLVLAAAAQAANPIRGNGFIGKGITMFHPTCASACSDSLSTYQLSCSTAKSQSKRGESYSQAMFTTSPECYASTIPYLASVASCISTHCSQENDAEDTSLPIIEAWWDSFLIGREIGQPKPMIPFTAALIWAATTNSSEERGVDMRDDILTDVTAVDESIYTANYNAQYYLELSEERHVDFGLVLFLSGLILPIILSWLRFIPFPSRLTTLWTATFITPPLIGHRHREPINNLFLMPTRGQAIFIAYLITINIILCSINYTPTPNDASNSYFPNHNSELLTYIANRTGILCFANIPLLIIYSTRNNPLLIFLTNWSHATFLMLHRWIALIATTQASVHAGIYLFQAITTNTYAESVTMRFWIWGSIAVLAMVLMMPASILPLRRRAYEVFLACHVVLAVLVLVAGYLHVWYKYQGQWGHENWLVYLAVPIWGAERIVRVGRLARFGVRKGRVSLVTGDGVDGGGEGEYVRVDIPGVVARGNAYLYFPGLSWRVWENHPFSVAGNMLPVENAVVASACGSMLKGRRKGSSESEDFRTLVSRVPGLEKELSTADLRTEEPLSWPWSRSVDAEKQFGSAGWPFPEECKSISDTVTSSRWGSEASADFPGYCQRGSTFFIRASKGITSRLRDAAAQAEGLSTTLSVLVESSYRSPAYNEVLECPNVIAIAGGVGITAVAPLIQARSGVGRTRLFWGLRDPALLWAVEDAFGKTDMFNSEVLGQIAAGHRLDIKWILNREVPETGKETVVVVCGPGSMADEVRECVNELARRGRMVKLADETFAW